MNNNILTEVNLGGLKFPFINVIALKKRFTLQVNKDKKSFNNISIYYELMSKENCELLGDPYDYITMNCIDGYDLYNQQKIARELNGYTYGKPIDVIIDGIKAKRIIIKGPEKDGNYGNIFGFISGYVQAGCEIVCYMVRY